MAEVVLEHLTKEYPDKSGRPVRAVNAIDLTVADREFMVLVGPSGCGKTSTLRLIAGLEEITAGTVRIGGRIVNRVAPKDRDIAMVFQNYALYPHMTVRENLAFGLRLRSFSSQDVDQRVREAAALLGLEECLERRPKALSGGQRQRVALGRAIVRKPKVFLFDEPLSNLDAKMRVAMRAELLKLRARLSATMIYVTHDQVEAMTMGDRICVMNAGEIQQVDAPLTVYRKPANLFVASFIGSPAMNLFRGRIEADGGLTRFVGDAALRVELPAALAARASKASGAEIVLGLRPEHVRAEAGGKAPGRLAIDAELVEPLGPEAYLHGRIGATPVVARVESTARYAAGESVPVRFDLAEASVFEARTGAAL